MNFFADPDFLATVRARRAKVALGFGFLLGRAGLVLLIPLLAGKVTDQVFARAGWGPVMTTLLAMLGVAAATSVCQFGMRFNLIGTSRDVELRLRENLFRHLTRLSWPFFNRSRTGDLMSRLTSDVEAVRMGVGPGVMYIMDTGLRTIGALVVMLRIAPILTLAAVGPMLVMFLGLRRLLRRIHDLSLRVQEEQGALASRAQESFSGARVIKAFGRERQEEARFEVGSRRWADVNLDLAKARALLTVFIETGGDLALAGILLLGGFGVIAGRLTEGSLVSFIGYLSLLTWPMIAMGWVLALWERARAAEGRLKALRGEAPEIVDPPAGVDPPPGPIRGAITFRNLTYRHGGAAENVLEDVSIEIPAGGSLGIVGRTGSGKSTLVNLIPRLLDPPPGTVFVDGRDVRTWPLGALRGSIGFVPQDTFLFSDTIEANVAFGLDSADDEAIRDAVDRASLAEAVASFPEGLRTRVGERGVTLSGGQRQRTALARALAVDPRILILDDCLSAVDAETEDRILGALREVIATRTTLVISHRMSAVMNLDRIVVLDGGRVVEAGTHAELMARDGLYAGLVRLQQVEAGLEAAP